MFKLLYVCDGNTCRSPIAQALTGDLLASTGCDVKIDVDSAGIYAGKESKPLENAIKVMAERGIDISDFKSKTLTKEIVDKADVILTMNHPQKKQLKEMYPESSDKILTLIEAANISKNFKKIIDKKVLMQTKNFSGYEHLSNAEMRLRSLADLGTMDSVLNESVEGREFQKDSEAAQDINEEIFDPYGGTLEQYEQCAKTIEGYVADIVSFICAGE